MILPLLTVTAIGYLLGSLSFAVWIGRLKGVDILKEGSGNPGATNVKRVLGSAAGNTVFLLDVAKGALAAAFPLLLGAESLGVTPAQLYQLGIIGCLAAIIGHSFSCFLGFRGGKGVAVTMGGLAVVLPWSLLIGVVVWVVVFKASGYVSLASIAFAASLPLSTLLLAGQRQEGGLTFATAMAILIIYRHRGNIVRLRAGTEHRFGKKQSPQSSDG